jgi:hypothetical protein
LRIYNSSNQLVQSLSNQVQQLQALSAPVVLTAITAGLTIYIDNSNGDDTSVNPSAIATPFKTFAKALEFARKKYYFSDGASNYLQLILLSDYNFGFGESAVFDGSLITGSVSLIVSSNDTTPRTITASAKQPIVFRNFSYELQLKTLVFSANSSVDISFIPRVLVTLVTFQKLLVRFCDVFYDLVNGSTFNSIAIFTNVDDVRFLATSIIKNLINVNKATTVYFGGQIDLGSYLLTGVTNAIFNTGSSVNEATLALANSGAIFTFRECNLITMNGILNLNSTTGILRRRLMTTTNVNVVRTTSSSSLALNNTYSGSISYQGASDGIFKFIHSEVGIFNLSRSTGFSPVFTAPDNTKKLISLEYSAYSTGFVSTTEAAIISTIFATIDRPVTFDIYSSFFAENIVNKLQLARTYRRSFTNSDLSGSLLSVNHNLGQVAPSVWIYDSSGEQINPLRINVVDSNNLNINLEVYTPLVGTYNLVIQG